MWRPDAIPRDDWQARHGFAPDSAWVARAQGAVLRLPGCTAAVVSAHGLVLTNHHCVRAAAAEVEPVDSNYRERGFVAGRLADERRLPGFYADRLDAIDDVTALLVAPNGAPLDGTPQRARIDALIEACEGPTTVCEVVPLYHGARFARYRYTRFRDVRLVALPEARIAYFGGDHDNFTYPRWSFDVALLRLYGPDGRPLAPSQVLRPTIAGPREGDPIVVVGHPGTTSRLLTVAQLEYERDVALPAQRRAWQQERDDRAARAGRTPSAIDADRVQALDNALKALDAQLAGLHDPALLSARRTAEALIREQLRQAPPPVAALGTAWDRLATLVQRRQAVAPRAALYAGGGSRLWALALDALRVAEQSPLPDSARLASHRGAALARQRARVAGPMAFDSAGERRAVEQLLHEATRLLPPADPLRRWLGERRPSAVASTVVAETRMGDAAMRERLMRATPQAQRESSDPLVQLVRVVAPLEQAARDALAAIDAAIASETARVGAAHLAVYGPTLPPDATFALRLQDGVVRGYAMNGTLAPWMTSFYGLYARWTEFGRRGDFALPPRWVQRKELLDLATPLTFVSTADIAGGNSGSPVLDRAGTLVGLVFDGNIESLPSVFGYRDGAARTVSVHPRAIVTALRVLYDAPHLADEFEHDAPPREVRAP